LFIYSPSANAQLIDHEKPVDIVFNEAIDHASVNRNTFSLGRADNTPVDGSYRFIDAFDLNGTLARFVPNAP
jgi:hypothetical protein